jgi:inorganic pyrophosphatase/manganese-dependent inorganic pyrophosphatase
MIIVTSGSRYIDIDAYACCVAYAELLNLLGRPAVAASTAVWNESITSSIRALDAPFATSYEPQAGDQFVLTDLSDPEHFDTIVDLSQVIEVHDHHPGFEQYWGEKLGEGSNIEFIGAAATLIYELWQKAGKTGEMSAVSAELLAAAILDNTLNFGAGVTTNRDKLAYGFLAKHAKLDDSWVASYFTECQEAITADLAESLRNDTKFLAFAGLPEKLCLGQMVVWDARQIIADDSQAIAATLGGMQELWMANVVSISEGKSYFVARNDEVKEWAKGLLGIRFDGNVAPADRLWLRKEIMKVGLAR